MLRAFVNRLSQRYFSIFQVNTISAVVTLEFSFRHASSDKIAGGVGGEGKSAPSRDTKMLNVWWVCMVCMCFALYHFGISAWG